MRKKLIKKGQIGMSAPLTYNSIQERYAFNNSLAQTIPPTIGLKLKVPEMSLPSKPSNDLGFLKNMSEGFKSNIGRNIKTPAPVAGDGPLTSLGMGQAPPPNTKGAGVLKGVTKAATGGAGAGGGMAVVSSTLSGISSLLPDANNSETTNKINSGLQMGADAAIASGDPTAAGIGMAVKVLGIANKAASAITDGRTTINDADLGMDKVLSSDIFALSPVGLVNSLGKTKVKGSDTSLAKDVDLGYQASDEVKKAEYGFLTGLFGRGRRKKKERQAAAKRVNLENASKSMAIQEGKRNLMLANNSAQDIQSRTSQQLQGGVNTNILAAKLGAKLDKPQNVIPSGALHARKHHLEGDLSELVTDRGIPVITGDLAENGGMVVLEDGGKCEQTAEIEHSEIIFHLELTKKIENLLKKYEESEGKEKDKLAIEAGKLLTFEILENTSDNVGLIEKIE